MLSGVQFRELVSGRRRDMPAVLLRGLLGVLEHPYRWMVARKNERFDRGEASSVKISAPLISVGNLSVGGTGKTPFVAWLGEWFLARGAAITIISRGYGAKLGAPNDEALELSARLPGVPHLQNADRVVAARAALAVNSRQVLILDDAFQHRRIGRDLDIVLLDALEPFGYEHLLPRGLLREPIAGLARAQVVGLSRSDAISGQERDKIRAIVRTHAPQAIWLELEHRPQGLVSNSHRTQDFEHLRHKRVAAFCGIGNPAGFRHTLGACGIELLGFLELPDHCLYGERDLAQIDRWLKPLDVTQVLCTRKDLVKIPREHLGNKELWAVDVRLEITEGRTELEGLLQKLLTAVC